MAQRRKEESRTESRDKNKEREPLQLTDEQKASGRQSFMRLSNTYPAIELTEDAYFKTLMRNPKILEGLGRYFWGISKEYKLVPQVLNTDAQHSLLSKPYEEDSIEAQELRALSPGLESLKYILNDTYVRFRVYESDYFKVLRESFHGNFEMQTGLRNKDFPRFSYYSITGVTSQSKSVGSYEDLASMMTIVICKSPVQVFKGLKEEYLVEMNPCPKGVDKRSHRRMCLNQLNYVLMSHFSKQPEELENYLEDFLYCLKNLTKMTQKEFSDLLDLGGNVAEVARQMITELDKPVSRSVLANYHKIVSRSRQGGLEQGLEQGIEQGIKSEKVSICRKLLKRDLDHKTIQDITQLSLEEIERISSEMVAKAE